MKKKLYLIAAALMLVATIGIRSAFAYFTTYVVADGGVKISIGSTVTLPEEEMDLHFKLVTVMNTGNYDCYVRVKAFAGAEYNNLIYSDDNGKWSLGADGYYYYSEIVSANEVTGTLKIAVEGLKEVPEEGESFNVIVIQECTPVLFNEEGTAYANWNEQAEVLNNKTEEGDL